MHRISNKLGIWKFQIWNLESANLETLMKYHAQKGGIETAPSRFVIPSRLKKSTNKTGEISARPTMLSSRLS